MGIFKKLEGFLSSGTNLSSDRLNRFILLLNYLPIGLAMAFTIIYQTISRKEGVQWTELSYFMGSLAVFYGTILATKALTQSQENKKPTPNETDLK